MITQLPVISTGSNRNNDSDDKCFPKKDSFDCQHIFPRVFPLEITNMCTLCQATIPEHTILQATFPG